MKDFLTKKMYATRALFFAVGVTALNVSLLLFLLLMQRQNKKWIIYRLHFH